MKDKQPAGKLGIYIHIPFCRSKCDYCDFYSLPGQEGRMDGYQKALLAHLKEAALSARSFTVDTVYFGGGTPSYYGGKRLKELLAAVRKHYRVEKDAEITFEANPDSADARTLRSLRRAGFNRISLGMQSACPAELEAAGRPHTVEQGDEAVAAARKAGFASLSLDLIYGLPVQTVSSWWNTVEHALSLEPDHLSCYGLKVEPGTPLAARTAKGERLLSDDAQADLYLWTVARLAKAGFGQYEISNFAKPGFQSRHNLRYWLTRPYIGFGPGAHSDFGGRRYAWVRDLEGYITGVLEGSAPLLDSQDLIPQEERGSEYLMLRLRTSMGIEEWEYRRNFGLNFEPIGRQLEFFETHHWAELTGKRWHFTPQGFLLSNSLIVELLEAQSPTLAEQTFWRALQKRGGQNSLE